MTDEYVKIDRNYIINQCDGLNNLENLETLELSRKNINEIDENSFVDLRNLKKLNLGVNKLMRLKSNTFNGLENLDTLWLLYNEIEDLDENTFVNLNNLKQLALNENKLKRLKSNALNGLYELESLLLANNEIEELDENAFVGLNNLKKLFFDENKLKQLKSHQFKGLDNLVALEIYNNEIEDLDENAFVGLNNLKELYLGENKLKQLKSHQFEGCNNLELLDLHGNQIEEINTNAFVDLKYLNGLYLNENKLKKLKSQQFKGLENLETLDLNMNELEDIGTNVLVDLNNLKELNLLGNKLQKLITNALNGLGKLEILDLAENKIEQIDTNAFLHLRSIRILNLDRNELKTIESNKFARLSNLVYLSLRNNQIENIESNAFVGLSELKILFLEDNKFKKISPNAFKGLKVLEFLDLSNNSIEKFHPNLFFDLASLIMLYLQDYSTETFCRNLFFNLKSIEAIIFIESSDKLTTRNTNVSYLRKPSIMDIKMSQLNIERFQDIVANKIKEFRLLFDKTDRNWNNFLLRFSGVELDTYDTKNLIFEYYDYTIINNIDKYTEELLLKPKDEDERLLENEMTNNNNTENYDDCFGVVEYHNPYREHYNIDTTNSQRQIGTDVNRIRLAMIDTIRTVEKENRDHLESIKNLFEKNHSLTRQEISAEVFDGKFCFLLETQNRNDLIFKYLTIVTDYYVASEQINLLQKFIMNENKKFRFEHIKDINVLDDKNPNLLLYLMRRFILDKLNSSNIDHQVIRIELETLFSIEKLDIKLKLKQNEQRIVDLQPVRIICSKYDFFSLKSLEIKSNLTIGIEEINGFPNLQYLCLNNMKLIDSATFFTFLPFLVKLQLIKCDLSQLQSKSLCLERLKIVQVVSSQMRIGKTYELFNLNELSALVWLSLCDIKLSELQFESIKNLHSQLVVLELRALLGNRNTVAINRLFAGLEYPNLKKLDLSTNGFTKICESDEMNALNSFNFTNLKSLTTLILAGNIFGKIAPNAFSCLKNLESVRLHKLLNMQSLDANVFNGLVKLKTLDLSGNGFTHFDLGDLSNLPNLTCLI